jgi:hypothetical protein
MVTEIFVKNSPCNAIFSISEITVLRVTYMVEGKCFNHLILPPENIDLGHTGQTSCLALQHTPRLMTG